MLGPMSTCVSVAHKAQMTRRSEVYLSMLIEPASLSLASLVWWLRVIASMDAVLVQETIRALSPI